MKKRKGMIRRAGCIFFAVTMLASGISVYGQAEFSSGNEETEFVSEMEMSETEPLFEDGAAENFQTEEILDTKERPLMEDRTLTEEEKAEQLAPIKELKPLGEVPLIGSDLRSTYALYPEKYDARKAGIISPVKNQNPFGICWAFGLTSLFETSLLSQNKGLTDLSEEHLAYFFANRVNDPLGNTSGDKNRLLLGDYHQGGNDYLASIFLSTWSGLTTEESVPLPTDPGHMEDYSRPLPAGKAYETTAYLTDAAFSDYSVDRMKQMLTEKNSVSIMYYMDEAHYNLETGAYSYPENIGVNHIVVVVGWDDNYPKENFRKECGVISDGAWIVKNSWGSQWGDDGYFYLSYEDKTISALVTADATDKPRYPNNYFYDGSSGLQAAILSQGEAMANIFTAKAGKGRGEILGEVNVSTFSDNAEYEIQIYTKLRDPKDPTSGMPAYAVPYKCYQPIAGVKTIKVPEVPIPAGTKYSVVVTNTGSPLSFCCETDVYYYNWFACDAGIARGQGFYSPARGVWADLYDSSATPRIKAHTRTMDSVPAPKLSASSVNYNSIKLSWKNSPGIDGYMLYRTENGMPKKRIANLSAEVSSYSDTRLKTGVKYTYTLVPYIRVSGIVALSDKYSSAAAVPALNKPVFDVGVSVRGYNRVSWSKIPGATAYRVYRRMPGEKWKLLTMVDAAHLRYDDKRVQPGETYAYTVRAYRKTSQRILLSEYTNGEFIKAAPALQRVDSVISYPDGIEIKWTAQRRCDGYRIYRKTETGSWKGIKTISSRSTATYLDKTASEGVLYYYAVRAYVKEPYGNIYSRYTASSAVKRK